MKHKLYTSLGLLSGTSMDGVDISIIQSDGQYQFYTSNANSLTGTASFYKWTHIAMTKSGTTVRAYVDGKELWSTTDNNTDSVTNLITGWGYGSEYFPGFISNARFVNGSSVYTSEFDPPAVPPQDTAKVPGPVNV